MEWKIIHINETDSTNRWLFDQGGEDGTVVWTDFQTAGRGQGTNRWESERGQNLLFSILLHPKDIPANKQFSISMQVSLAICEALGEHIGNLSIKWPNDIYWRDKKVAGILIENAIVGSEIKYSIAGIGLNVNQTEYVSNAPNPISLKQISGKEYDIHELMQNLYAGVQRALDEDVWTEYKAHLYRKEGFWPFVEREVSVAPTMNAAADTEGIFMARIADVMPTGEIVLEDQAGKERKYHYKQIRYVV